MVDVSELTAPRTVIYCYPMTGVPGTPLPEGGMQFPALVAALLRAAIFATVYQELLD